MRLLTDAVLTKLKSGGRRVGDAHTPSNSTRPYAVLWPLFAAGFEGNLKAQDLDAWYRFQVTSVGDTREQAQGLSDELSALIKASYSVTGYSVGPVELEDVMPIERDDDVQPPVFYQSFTVSIFVTPA